MSDLEQYRSLDNALEYLDAMISAAVLPSVRTALLRQKGLLLELSGNYAAAAGSLQSALDHSGVNADSTLLLSTATTWLNSGEPDKAMALLARALRGRLSAEELARAELAAGWASLTLGQDIAALLSATRVIAMNQTFIMPAAFLLAASAATGTEKQQYADKLQQLQETASSQDLGFQPYMMPAWAQLQFGASLIPSEAASTGSVSAASETSAVEAPLFYQTGAFGNAEYAEAAMARLRAAGFQPQRVQRSTTEPVLIVVYVPAGNNPARTLIALKDAGFEAWPLYAAP
ncbi:MAG: hypothetical protein KKC64_13670 [Spirochaetes bacterium]|nr:hypothetical protein [Spirochaetota bacterium]